MLACDRTRHARKNDGFWVQGENDIYQAVIQGNGVLQIRVRCGNCNQSCGFLPHDVWRRWVRDGAVLTGTPQVHKPTDQDPCSYANCPNLPTEYHHFAPWNTFGNDADNWPVMPLCREHHHAWHRTMDGYRWHRRGIWRDTA